MSTLQKLPAALFVDFDQHRSAHPPATAKYMLLEVQMDGEKRIILRTAPTKLNHRNILEVFGYEADDHTLPRLTVQQLGGGYLASDENSKRMIIGGQSRNFGPANHVQAQELLQAALPDYTITIDNNLIV